ncbi:MAG: hypothetical protein ACPHRO_11465 [Nannocystaceae bacterium]
MHIGFSVGVSIALLVLFSSRAMAYGVRPWVWVLAPIAFLGTNVAEYVFHRYPMHHRPRRKRPLWERFFHHHTLSHHRYFDDRHLEVRKLKELFFVMTTTHATGVSALGLVGTYFALRFTAGVDVAGVVCSAIVAYGLALEIMHLAFHLPAHYQRVWPMNTRLHRNLRRHHRAHHDPRMMTRYNFNIVFPFTDWIMGTLMPAEQESVYKPPPVTAPPVESNASTGS